MYEVASALAIWQRTIENILKDISDITVFLDDIKIASISEEKHFENLELVLKRLSEYNIRINLKTCSFLKDQISYCGYVIGKFSIKKKKEKMDAIDKLPKPSNVSEVRAFVGLINYYGRFIENLSNIIIRSLNGLLKKKTSVLRRRNAKKLLTVPSRLFVVIIYWYHLIQNCQLF